MTRESLYAPEPIFRETFNSEFDTRKNGGTPTDVTYANGKGTFNGSSSKVNYALGLNGTYSVRIRLNPDVIANNDYILDARADSGTGFIYFNGVDVYISNNGTRYVDGVATNSVSTDSRELFISGISIISNNSLSIGEYFNGGAGFEGTIDLVEIYKGTLTASEVANLYNKKTYRNLPPEDVLIDFDCRNGAIEDKQVGSTVGDDIMPATTPASVYHCTAVRVSQGVYNITTTSSASTNIWGWNNVYESNKKYRMSFQAKSDDTTITPSFFDGTENKAFDTGGALTTEWQTYTVEFIYGSDVSTRFFMYQGQPSVGDVINYRGLVVYELRDDLDITSTTIAKDGSYAAKFNGTTSKIDTGTDMIGTKAITVMGWVKAYVYEYNGFFGNDKFYIYANNNQTYHVTSDDRGTNIQVYNGEIKLNKWTFIALTRAADGKVYSYYGTLDSSPVVVTSNGSSGTPVDGTNFLIGARGTTEGQFMEGLISKLKVVEGILDLATITQEWSSTRRTI